MSEWKAKRFWTEASVVPCEGGFTVELDGRPVKTPLKTLLVVPTRAMAEVIAAEWDAQEGEIKPATMPVTRAANAALDKVTHQHAEVVTLLAAYGDSDLLCYRADSPQELVQRQAEAWDPLLDWAEAALGARLEPRTGVMHASQDPRALNHLSKQVHAMDPFCLTAFHDLVALTGSLVLAFAAIHERSDMATLWALSRLDEIYQQEQWGVDEEAAELSAWKESEFVAAKRFYDLSLPKK